MATVDADCELKISTLVASSAPAAVAKVTSPEPASAVAGIVADMSAVAPVPASALGVSPLDEMIACSRLPVGLGCAVVAGPPAR